MHLISKLPLTLMSWQDQAMDKIIKMLEDFEETATHKQDTGLAPYMKPMECLCQANLSSDEVGYCGCEDSRNGVLRDLFIGSYSPPSARKCDSTPSKQSSTAIGSHPEVKPPKNTFGKRTRELPEANLNSAKRLFRGTAQRIGDESKTLQNKGKWTQSSTRILNLRSVITKHSSRLQ